MKLFLGSNHLSISPLIDSDRYVRPQDAVELKLGFETHNQEISTSPTLSELCFILRVLIYQRARWRKPWTCTTYEKLHTALFIVNIMTSYSRWTCSETELVEKIWIVFLRRIKMITSITCNSGLCDWRTGKVVLAIKSSGRAFQKYAHVAGLQQLGTHYDSLLRLLKISILRNCYQTLQWTDDAIL